MTTRPLVLLTCLVASWQACGATPASAPNTAPPDTLEARVQGCATCHGTTGQGIAASTGDAASFPAIAGKPQGYLYNQLLNFREGRRSYPPMNYLLTYLHDDYLQEMAGFFAQQPFAYPAKPEAPTATAQQLAQGEALVKQGDKAHGIPACSACHGTALTGLRPNVPGLLGLRSRYISGQIEAWRIGTRHAAAPDCMSEIVRRLSDEQVTSVSSWLAQQPRPLNSEAPAPGAWRLALPCGSQPQ